MSERITQELRDAMSRYSTFGGDSVVSMEEEGFENHCAAIDSIHANLERENDRLKCELDRVLGELDEVHKTEGISNNTDGFMQNAEHHAWAPESHYMMLPKDADGEPIHVGDVVEWADGSTCEVVGIGDGGTLYYMDEIEGTIGWTNANGKRHHHADSWERIIEDAVNVHGNGFNPCWTDERERELRETGEDIVRDVRREWVRLPVDADGVPIHVGERVQIIGNDPGTVSHMSLAEDGWRVYVKYDGDLGTGSGQPSRIRHHHAPTVEDVLTEFGIDWEHESDCEDRAALLKEYAAKLQLRGDAE